MLTGVTNLVWIELDESWSLQPAYRGASTVNSLLNTVILGTKSSQNYINVTDCFTVVPLLVCTLSTLVRIAIAFVLAGIKQRND